MVDSAAHQCNLVAEAMFAIADQKADTFIKSSIFSFCNMPSAYRSSVGPTAGLIGFRTWVLMRPQPGMNAEKRPACPPMMKSWMLSADGTHRDAAVGIALQDSNVRFDPTGCYPLHAQFPDDEAKVEHIPLFATIRAASTSSSRASSERGEFLGRKHVLQMIELNAADIHEIDTLGHLSFARRSSTSQRPATKV
jgi:hypothetical protein